MYRRPKFLEILLEIRQEMAREADYDTDLFAEMVRSDERGTAANGTAKRKAARSQKKASRRSRS